MTVWIEKDISTASITRFHASFISYCFRLARSLPADSENWSRLSDGERQVMSMLRSGFPVTDPVEYIKALEFYKAQSWSRGMTKGVICDENFEGEAALLPFVTMEMDPLTEKRRS